jgi:hypothetical protein
MTRAKKEPTSTPESTIEDVKISDIITNGKYSTNYREAGDVSWLSDSIKEFGLQTPIWVVRDGTGDAHFVAGGKRIAATVALGHDTIRARVFSSTALRSKIGQTIVLLRAIENSRAEATFADTVRSCRQCKGERLSAVDTAIAWGLQKAYVDRIYAFDRVFPVGWEDKLTKNQADLLAGATDPAGAYNEFIETGKLPAKKVANPGRGRGAAAAKYRGLIVAEFPWAEGLPWELGIKISTADACKVLRDWAEKFAADNGLEQLVLEPVKILRAGEDEPEQDEEEEAA